MEPFVTSHVLINAGERYGVLLHTTPDAPSESWIMLETRYRKRVAGYGVLSATTGIASRRDQSRSPLHEPPTHPGSWSSEANVLESQYIKMEANNTSADDVGKIKDRVSCDYKLWADRRSAGMSSDAYRLIVIFKLSSPPHNRHFCYKAKRVLPGQTSCVLTK